MLLRKLAGLLEKLSLGLRGELHDFSLAEHDDALIACAWNQHRLEIDPSLASLGARRILVTPRLLAQAKTWFTALAEPARVIPERSDVTPSKASVPTRARWCVIATGLSYNGTAQSEQLLVGADVAADDLLKAMLLRQRSSRRALITWQLSDTALTKLTDQMKLGDLRNLYGGVGDDGMRALDPLELMEDDELRRMVRAMSEHRFLDLFWSLALDPNRGPGLRSAKLGRRLSKPVYDKEPFISSTHRGQVLSVLLDHYLYESDYDELSFIFDQSSQDMLRVLALIGHLEPDDDSGLIFYADGDVMHEQVEALFNQAIAHMPADFLTSVSTEEADIRRQLLLSSAMRQRAELLEAFPSPTEAELLEFNVRVAAGYQPKPVERARKLPAEALPDDLTKQMTQDLEAAFPQEPDAETDWV